MSLVLLDEVDAFPADVDGEGDPCALAERRASTFSRRKIILTSTPTVKDMSRIETEYLASNQMRYFVPCPHCGLCNGWSGRTSVGVTVIRTLQRYACNSCGAHIPEHHKSEMLRREDGGLRPDGRSAHRWLSPVFTVFTAWLEELGRNRHGVFAGKV